MALIHCPECNKEISSTVKKCPNCGYKLKLSKREDNQSGVGRRIQWWKILIVVVVAAMAVGGGTACYYYVNSPVRRVRNELQKGNINQAQALFDGKMKSDPSLVADLKMDLPDVLSSVISDYAENDIKYDAYQKLKEFISANYKDYDLASYDKQAEEMKASKASYDEAKKDQGNKKYSDAIEKYQKVIKKDANHADAQTQIEKCKSEHKKLVLGDIDKQLSSNEPSYAEIQASIINTDYLKKDQDLSKKLNELKEKVRDYQIGNAEALAKKGEYLEAFQALKAIPVDFSEDSRVKDTKNNIANAMVDWVTKEASALAAKKKYQQAIALLGQYNSYDTGKTISKQMSSYREKVKKAVIAEFKEIKKKLTLKYDSVDKEYTVVNKGYDPDYINISRSINIEARAVVDKKDKSADFQLIAGFQQDDWIFTEEVKFASGKYREAYIIQYSDRYTQVMNYGGGIVEWMYLNNLTYSELFDSMETLVSKITTSKKATMRFSASGQGSRNHTITASEKSNIRNVFKFCEMLKQYEYLYKYI